MWVRAWECGCARVCVCARVVAPTRVCGHPRGTHSCTAWVRGCARGCVGARTHTVWMRAHTHTRARVREHVHTVAYPRAHTRVGDPRTCAPHTWVCACTHTPTRAGPWVRACSHTCACAHTCVCTHTPTCAPTCVRACAHTHTRTTRAHTHAGARVPTHPTRCPHIHAWVCRCARTHPHQRAPTHPVGAQFGCARGYAPGTVHGHPRSIHTSTWHRARVCAPTPG